MQYNKILKTLYYFYINFKNFIYENKTIFFNGFIANDHICTIQQRWLKYGRNF